MMNLTFTFAYGILLIAILLGILSLGLGKYSAVCCGQN